MNLRQLRYFLAVAETLHFGRAAKRLNMAQPPLSAQIKQLEADLGVLLFERTKRRVALTAAGEVLRQEAQQVMQKLAVARRKTQAAGQGLSGQLAIAFVSSAMYSILPPWLSAFRQRYPAAVLTLQEASTAEQVKGLLNHRFDIGFVRPPIASPVEDSGAQAVGAQAVSVQEKIASRVVLQEPLVVALPSDHPLSRHANIRLAELAHEDFVMFPRSLAIDLHDKIIGFCQQANFSPKIVQTASQLQTLLGLVAAQLGIAILPAAASKLQREGVCYRPFLAKPPGECIPMTELKVIWRADGCLPVLTRFLDSQPSG
ncbi:MAG: LysR family transcriptional regulator [Cyanobacteria bacterium P01_A01_bin.116]